MLVESGLVSQLTLELVLTCSQVTALEKGAVGGIWENDNPIKY